MDVLALCAVAVIAAVSALLLRRQSPQISLLISAAAGVIILMSVTRELILSADEIAAVMDNASLSADRVMILLKALGICLVTEFTCDTVTEAGMLSLSSNVSFAGKVMVLFTAMPLFRDILTMLTELVGES